MSAYMSIWSACTKCSQFPLIEPGWWLNIQIFIQGNVMVKHICKHALNNMRKARKKLTHHQYIVDGRGIYFCLTWWICWTGLDWSEDKLSWSLDNVGPINKTKHTCSARWWKPFPSQLEQEAAKQWEASWWMRERKWNFEGINLSNWNLGSSKHTECSWMVVSGL